MQVVSSPQLFHKTIQELRIKGKSTGLVPTMGALHDGHLSLIKRSKQENDITVVSVFVNPLQFNNEEDFIHYPRAIEEDSDFLRKNDVDVLFAPSESEMYPERPILKMDFGSMTKTMEGRFRPGHFEGVGIVVNKLLSLGQPDRAYFGLKDLQQYLIIRRMVYDLSMPVEIVGLPIVREASGLAMSSRNRRLSDEGKEIAKCIYTGLELIQEGISLERGADELFEEVMSYYSSVTGLEIEYLEIVNASNLKPVSGDLSQFKELAVCVAGYVEGIRLIDNLYLRQD